MAHSASELTAQMDEAGSNSPIPISNGLRFVYRGPAEAVEVTVMEDRFPDVPAMTGVGDQIWYADVPLDDDGAVEYRLTLERGGHRRQILDPLNALQTRNPFGSNSVAIGPGYRPPTWLKRSGDRGRVIPFGMRSRVWGGLRRHLAYLPPGFDPAVRYPLLLLHDGPEYVEYAGLSRCLDVLVSASEIPPLIVILHRPQERTSEYVDNPRHLAHVVGELLPRARERFRVGPVLAGGASLGAVASMSLAHRHPGLVSGVLSQSGSFVTALGGRFRRGKVLEPVTRLVPELVGGSDQLAEVMVMSCGTYDGLVEDHRRLVPQLKSKVGDLIYQEIHAGHHWRCWRDRLGPDLIALLTGLGIT